jgi:uncharacterized membrane protein
VHTIEESIEVKVPIRMAYNQWTQFEQFPSFMEGVKQVQQLDDRHLFWRAEVMNKPVSWTAEITHQIPDERIAWRSISGPAQHGTITFSRLEPSKTRLSLRLEFEPEGAGATAATALGLVTARIKGDLQRFKKFIEERGVATGEWRGEIESGRVTRSPSGEPAEPRRN